MKAIYYVIGGVLLLAIGFLLYKKMKAKSEDQKTVDWLNSQYTLLQQKSGKTDLQDVLDWYNSHQDEVTQDVKWTIGIINKAIKNGVSFSQQASNDVAYVRKNK